MLQYFIDLMSKKAHLNHVALQCSDREKASIFFTQILKIPKLRDFSITQELSSKIFGINKNIEIDVYDNSEVRFEVFILERINKPEFEHVCIDVEDIEDFINTCQKFGLEPFTVKKGERDLLFVRDFSGNLYEIKEKNK